MSLNFIISGSTDIGNVKKTNQDSIKVMSMSSTKGNFVFAVLCDGMGGLAKGEVASSYVIKTFEKWAKLELPKLLEKGITDEEISTQWCELITKCNEKVKEFGKNCGVSLGTTITAMLISPQRYYIVNVGDTRAYEVSDKTHLLTNDQTVVSLEVAQGLITKEQAKLDPRRSILLQCIGASERVSPEIIFGESKQNVTYMLCSDGFRHEISREEIFNHFRPERMLNDSQMKKAEIALIKLNKQRHERDNISVITIRTY